MIENNVEFKIKKIVPIIFIGFLISFVYHFVYQTLIVENGYPYTTFLFAPYDRFQDFYNMIEICKDFSPYSSVKLASVYYPLANILFMLLSLIPSNVAFILYLVIIVPVTYYAISNYFIELSSTKKYTYSFLFLVFNYGFIYAMDRGNIEIIVFVLLLLFAYFYSQKRYYIALLFLSLGIAMKLYPAVFLVLFLSDKKYKEIAYSIGIVILISLLSLCFFKGGFIENGLFLFSDFGLNNESVFNDNGYELQQGTSLFSFIKIVNIKYALSITGLLPKYFLIVAIIAVVFVCYVLFIETILWKKIFLLTGLMIILPHVSFDYKLMHVVIPLLIYVNTTSEKSKTTYNILFALLLIPKSYFYFNEFVSRSGLHDISISTIMNPMLILIMMLFICYEGIKNNITIV